MDEQRFGQVGIQVANSLPFFSLDLCSLICKYLFFAPCSSGKTPSTLLEFSTGKKANEITEIAYRDKDDTIWTFLTGRIVYFDKEGHFIDEFASAGWKSCYGIDFYKDSVVFSIWGSMKLYSQNAWILPFATIKNACGFQIFDGDFIAIANLTNKIYICKMSDYSQVSIIDTGDIRAENIRINSMGEFVLQCGFNYDITILNPKTNQRVCKIYEPNLLDMTLDTLDNVYCFSQIKSSEPTTVHVYSSKGKKITTFNPLSNSNHCTSICVDKQYRILIGDEFGHVHVLGFCYDS